MHKQQKKNKHKQNPESSRNIPSHTEDRPHTHKTNTNKHVEKPIRDIPQKKVRTSRCNTVPTSRYARGRSKTGAPEIEKEIYQNF